MKKCLVGGGLLCYTVTQPRERTLTGGFAAVLAEQKEETLRKHGHSREVLLFGGTAE